jgi:hypothetical protein
MAVFNRQQGDTFETAFEQGMTTVKNTTKQVVKTLAGDVMEQVTGQNRNSKSNSKMADSENKILPPEKQNQVDAQQKKLLDETRMNLIELNKKIDEARKKRLQKEQETQRLAQSEKQKKFFSEEKKKKESIELQNIKKQGAGEILKGASG